MLQRVLREERGALVALAIALVVNLALYGLVVRPMSRRVAETDVRAAAAEQARRAAAAELASVRAVASGKAKAERDLKTFYEQVLPADLSAAQRATYVSLAQLARDTSLRLSRRVASQEGARGSSLERLQIGISLEGDYRNVRNFIYRLETSPSFMVIEDMSIEQAAAEGDQLRLSMKLSTYYRAGGNGD